MPVIFQMEGICGDNDGDQSNEFVINDNAWLVYDEDDPK